MSMFFFEHLGVKVSTCWWLTGKGFCWQVLAGNKIQICTKRSVYSCDIVMLFPHLQVIKRYDRVKLAETHWVMPCESSIMNQTSMRLASCTYIWHRLGWYPSAIDIHLIKIIHANIRYGGVPNKALWTTLNNWQYMCNPFAWNLLVPSRIWESEYWTVCSSWRFIDSGWLVHSLLRWESHMIHMPTSWTSAEWNRIPTSHGVHHIEPTTLRLQKEFAQPGPTPADTKVDA